jgi:WD40 repeat protein
LGAILYELLTGRPPFKAATPLDTVLQVLREVPVAVRRLQPKAPRDVETICHKCLEKDPRKRYASAAALGADLRAFLEGRPIAARPAGVAERIVKAVRRRPAIASLLALIVVAIVGGIAGIWYQYQDTRRALGEASSNAELYRTANEKAEHALRKESAARASEKVATEKQARNLYTAHMNLVQRAWERADLQYARELLERHIPEDERAPDFRGFEWYYFWRLTHSASAKLADLPETVRALAASPDGRRLAIACASGARFVWETTGGAKPVPFHVEGMVSCLAYSPDGKWLAAGTGTGKDPGIVYLLDARTLEVRHALKGHSTRVFAVAFTPDSLTLISAGTAVGDGNGTPWTRYYNIEKAETLRGEVRFWNLTTPGQGMAADFGTSGGLALSVSPNGRWLAVGRTDGRALLVDLPSRKVEATLGRHQYPVWAVAVSDDGQVATGGGQWDNAELILWSDRPPVEKLRLGVNSERIPGSGIRLTEVLADSLAEKAGLRAGDVIIQFDVTDVTQTTRALPALTATMQRGKQTTITVKRGMERVVLKVTPPGTGTPAPKAHEPIALVGHTSCVQGATFTRDGAGLLTVSLDRTLRMWDATTGRSLATDRGHTDGIWSLALLADDHTVFTGGIDRAIFGWDLRKPQEYREVKGTSPGHQIHLIGSPVDGTFLQNMGDGYFKIDSETGRIMRRLAGGRLWCYDQDGTLMLVLTGFDKEAKNLGLVTIPCDSIKDPSSNEGIMRLAGQVLEPRTHADFTVTPGQARSLVCRRWPRGGTRCLITPNTEFEKTDDLQIWNVAKEAREPVAIKPRPRQCDFSPSGKYFWSYYWDDASLHVWDLDARRQLLRERYSSTVSGANFSPGERYVAAATHDGIIRVWEVDGLRLIRTFRTRADATWGLCFTKDERTLLASNWDGRIRLWDVDTGEERLTLSSPGGAAHDIGVTPDGRTVIGAYDGNAVIWQAAKDAEVPRYRPKK